ncbi:MAG: HlyD family efflux transporter periplasmic adaptor subunit [Sedimentisphaerales bacterium]|nr:HlyD family efflux transporter periplasmic adaptor subunit [Sedimentisphaerales bacterium]
MKRNAAPKNHEHKHFRVRHAIPVMVWLAAVASIMWLFHVRARRFQVVGIARGEVRQVAASSTGRIRDIPVSLYEPVIAGQTLAVVDTILDNEQTLEVELTTQLAGVEAEIEHLAAQLIPTQELMQAEARNLQISRAGDLTRLAMDVDSYRVRVLQLKGSIAPDDITLSDLEMQRATYEKLVKDDLISPYELDRVKAQCASLAKKIQEQTQLLGQAQADLTKAEARLKQFAGQTVAEPPVDQTLEVIRKEIGVQETLMEGLLERLRALKSRRAVEIKSPIEGVVIPIAVRENDASQQRPGEQVMRRVGEVVRAGDPILAVAQKEPTEIVAYVSEQQLSELREDMTVELIKLGPPAQIAQSQIMSISPTMELMPQRLWRNPNIPQWGRPVVIGIPTGLSLVAGEVVGIRGL